ncbi:MAG TPA: LPS assembly lipoprotein LptE, partial [Tepidisphaeraceae bacterium]|nr:LPS assembly lipoprotein LptE [Tepidisphaeraceae bacterium]
MNAPTVNKPFPTQRHARSTAAGTRPPSNNPPPWPSLTAALLALICILSPGCANLEQPALAKSYFAIDPGLPSPAAATRPSTNPGILTVAPLHIASPYDGLSFVYKIGPAQFDFDHYNIFVAPPASLLTGSLINWLNRAGPLPTVSDANSLRSDLILEGNITALYIDSTAAPKKAILTARFFLLRQRPTQTRLLAEFPLSESTPVETDSPAGFIGAF